MFIIFSCIFDRKFVDLTNATFKLKTFINYLVNSFLLVTSVQAGAVMADSKHVDPYRGWHDGSAGQPDLRSCHCGVYIRCDGTAVIPRRIYS